MGLICRGLAIRKGNRMLWKSGNRSRPCGTTGKSWLKTPTPANQFQTCRTVNFGCVLNQKNKELLKADKEWFIHTYIHPCQACWKRKVDPFTVIHQGCKQLACRHMGKQQCYHNGRRWQELPHFPLVPIGRRTTGILKYIWTKPMSKLATNKP